MFAYVDKKILNLKGKLGWTDLQAQTHVTSVVVIIWFMLSRGIKVT